MNHFCFSIRIILQQLIAGDVVYALVTSVQRVRINPGCYVRLLCTHPPKNLQFNDLNIKVYTNPYIVQVLLQFE